ncbi:MAG: hypothetical protein A3G52_01260 [Candidatus Taylorbacteria bacterium RIFCSPLOWO2_12_FULL_43_20]|uniref:Uncharacterized protein n=1 Tax=Candidatus Taylorbacteria bacterium RIFCSPLOWO2_12_FULL_43_20 TaxID=1802332 RepID=A0A1G2P3F2_9BACT|nr:MAG: hypothetical protein A2825_00655 [Candidatus Taylorbacteria bacterium RIFCSPHIGHO2_01_FULL_43_120]OHA22322.1 MAG: hypothetical protein A3B98_04380 [Candidatus Taylorbacteria bacterium RIFCSPHIGHO2_02_FULL_43_55]OHA30049.1 MAG: hypothetical protein A3E92_03340 [Candidatus Taylorbacteria bacterium RIFCSPHIGHO2_12_FULL_42_34]OHA30448.1 MAG: hypothetical protein A3B09_04405 [Candidatus Taylorbacteria bacterium RIFCSPLOWO2_01_FULL_43_83]OHA39530.1 MAG: hypothetical protein A3H58_02640 [Candi
MTPEERDILEKIYRVTEENNGILKSMRRSQRWSSIMRALYWVIIIIMTIAAYYFVQSYIETITSAFGGGEASTQNLIDQYRDLLQ